MQNGNEIHPCLASYNSYNKPIYLCSFYRPPDNNVHSITQPSELLHELCSNQVTLPAILLAEDFNLPGQRDVVKFLLTLLMALKLITL